MGKEWIFLQRRCTNGQKAYERFSASPIIREIQLKISTNDHLTLNRMATIKKTENNKCWQKCREIGAL
jgi:hypothetical protein